MQNLQSDGVEQVLNNHSQHRTLTSWSSRVHAAERSAGRLKRVHRLQGHLSALHTQEQDLSSIERFGPKTFESMRLPVVWDTPRTDYCTTLVYYREVDVWDTPTGEQGLK